MIRRPPRSTRQQSSAASDVYKRQAQDRVHELNAGYSLNRFSTGNLIDEKGLGTKTWIS